MGAPMIDIVPAVLLIDQSQSPAPVAKDDADALRLRERRRQAGVGDRHDRRSDGEDGGTVERGEGGQGQARGEGHVRDRADQNAGARRRCGFHEGAPAGDEICPKSVQRDAGRRHDAEAGHHDSDHEAATSLRSRATNCATSPIVLGNSPFLFALKSM